MGSDATIDGVWSTKTTRSQVLFQVFDSQIDLMSHSTGVYAYLRRFITEQLNTTVSFSSAVTRCGFVVKAGAGAELKLPASAKRTSHVNKTVMANIICNV